MTEVLFFAKAKEVAGMARTSVSATTVAEVLVQLIELHGSEMAAVCSTASIVVDGEMVLRSEQASASAGEELAVLPPVSGGGR